MGIRLSSLILIVLISGCALFRPAPPDIPFAPHDAPGADKPDFAAVEHDHPLTREDRLKITPQNIVSLSQEQVDQIYARLTAGPIPAGALDGNLFFPKGSSGRRRIAEVVEGFDSLVIDLKVRKAETIGRLLWKGKVFYPEQGVLRNRIQDTALLAPLIDGDPSDIPKIAVDTEEEWLMFPAKLFCGQSLLDGRRESIIIDYAFTDEIEGYRERPDYLAGRNGFMIRDEIRMVRPGFYLGRAYMGKFFLLNFTLYRQDIADRDTGEFMRGGAISEDCWTGEQ